jgi:DNA polymerase-3 subunit delta'
MMSSPVDTLSGALLPWLEPAFEQLAQAHRAGHLGHAWLLTGPEGIGKINLALALAGRLLGSSVAPDTLGAEPALEALGQRHAPADIHPDLHWLHPEEDKETISVDQVRGVIESLGFTAHQGATKVVIIEPAEAMTTPAANALLKTLEEPTRDSYLLLVCHRPGRLPATVRSRCQQLKLRPPAVEAVASWLGVAAATVEQQRRVGGESPLKVASSLKINTIDISGIEESLISICEDRLDCQSVAQAWYRGDPATPLAWLCRRLHEELRHRFAPDLSTGVTVPTASTLHNAWRGLSTRLLVEQHDRAEKLLNQLGSGVNVELALQALLSAFQTNRGRS